MVDQDLKQLFAARAKQEAALIKAHWDKNEELLSLLKTLPTLQVGGYDFRVQCNEGLCRASDSLDARRDGKKYCSPFYSGTVAFTNGGSSFKRLDIQLTIDGVYEFYDYFKGYEKPVATTTSKSQAAGILREWVLETSQKRVQDIVVAPA